MGVWRKQLIITVRGGGDGGVERGHAGVDTEDEDVQLWKEDKTKVWWRRRRKTTHVWSWMKRKGRGGVEQEEDKEKDRSPIKHRVKDGGVDKEMGEVNSRQRRRGRGRR